MTDTPLSGLPTGAPIAANDLFYSVQGGISVKQPATAIAALGGGIPAGLNGQVQYNNGGIFGGLTNAQLYVRVNPTWFNVMNYGATGNGVTDDTAAINSAIAAFNAAGNGVLYFPAGTYLTTASLTAITANGIIQGDGPTNLQEQLVSSVGVATQINCSSTTATVFTINSQQLLMRDLSIKNTAGGTPVAGSSGITVTSATEFSCKVDMVNVQVAGFYICIDRQAGSLWVMDNCLTNEPVLYGVKIRNIRNPDAGDWSIVSSTFYARANGGNPSGLRIESSGGGKIFNCKFNNSGAAPAGYFVYPIDLEGSGNTVDMQIANCSIENYSNTGILINGIAGTGWPNISIAGCELSGGVGGGTIAISVANTSAVTISDILNAAPNAQNGIILNNVTDIIVTNCTNTYCSTLGSATNIPATTNADNSNRYGTILGDGFGTLLQGGLLTTASQNATVDTFFQQILGTAASGGQTAQSIQGVQGASNRLLLGPGQKDFAHKISGGGNYWLGFSTVGDGSGNLCNALFMQPIGAPGLQVGLAILTGTSSGNSPLGWLQWGGEQRTATAVNYTNNTPTTIMSQPLIAGRTYSIDGYIPVTAGGNAGGVQVGLNASAGLTITSAVIDSIAHSNNVIVGQVQVTSLTTLTNVVLGAATGYVEFHGTITVNAAGTLNIQTAQSSTNATTMTIGRGARIICHDMP